MKGYRWHASVVLFLILAHTHVTVLPGWTVPAIPVLLVPAFLAMGGALLGVLRHQSRPRTRYRGPVIAGG